MNTTLPMGCAGCGVVRQAHDNPDHSWQPPTMPTVLARAAVLKNRRAAA